MADACCQATSLAASRDRAEARNACLPTGATSAVDVLMSISSGRHEFAAIPLVSSPPRAFPRASYGDVCISASALVLWSALDLAAASDDCYILRRRLPEAGDQMNLERCAPMHSRARRFIAA